MVLALWWRIPYVIAIYGTYPNTARCYVARGSIYVAAAATCRAATAAAYVSTIIYGGHACTAYAASFAAVCATTTAYATAYAATSPAAAAPFLLLR